MVSRNLTSSLSRKLQLLDQPIISCLICGVVSNTGRVRACKQDINSGEVNFMVIIPYFG